MVQTPNWPNLIIGWVAFIKVSSFTLLTIAWITTLAMAPRYRTIEGRLAANWKIVEIKDVTNLRDQRPEFPARGRNCYPWLLV
jgi:hypothetical protein